MEAKSNKYLFWISKYFFLYLAALLFISVIKTGWSISANLWKDVALLISLLTLHFITTSTVFLATVGNREIKMNEKITLHWEDVSLIQRIGFLYFLKSSRLKRSFIFPICTLPIRLLGISARETKMDQLVQLMIAKYSIKTIWNG